MGFVIFHAGVVIIHNFAEPFVPIFELYHHGIEELLLKSKNNFLLSKRKITERSRAKSKVIYQFEFNKQDILDSIIKSTVNH